MNNTLVILSHPDFAISLANKTIIETIQELKHDINIRHIDKIYPTYTINVEEEQNALLKANNIILQFPLYWYSVPASLKNWLDRVFTFNFAYGPDGDTLKNKNLFIPTTIGGPASSYHSFGYNHFSCQ